MSLNEFRILLIDDDEDEFVNIRDLLNEATTSRYSITWKSSFATGLKALREENFDICLLDNKLGAKSGIDLLHETQMLELSCPIILLTGFGDFNLDVQAMQCGAADYLVKSQLTAPLLERSIRYSMKHELDMAQLKDNKEQIMRQDRLASLGLLASSLAHEIGTPLGIIRSRAELAARKSADNSDLKQDMNIVVTQIDRIAKLVSSLLHLARGKSTELASSVNLNRVVQEVLNLVRHELDLKGIDLAVQIHEDITVKAESGSLGQVILNLMVNSIHAIEEAKETQEPRQHRIELIAEKKNELVKIYIKDTGCGISKENMAQIFKPFFTTKDVGMGTGLGLATSYKFIQSWDGSITAESEEGKGATFIITLLK